MSKHGWRLSRGERCLVRYWSRTTKDKNTAICWYGGTFYSTLVQVIGRLSFVRTNRADRPIVKCKASGPVLPFQGRVSLARNSSQFGSIVALHLQNGRSDWSVLIRGKRLLIFCLAVWVLNQSGIEPYENCYKTRSKWSFTVPLFLSFLPSFSFGRTDR